MSSCEALFKIYISVLIATPWLHLRKPSSSEKLYLQRGWCYRHQWRSATVQSWMDNSGSCAVLGSCLWKESHAAGITDRSCSHGWLLYWWDRSSLLFGWPCGHQVHTTGSTCDTQYGCVCHGLSYCPAYCRFACCAGEYQSLSWGPCHQQWMLWMRDDNYDAFYCTDSHDCIISDCISFRWAADCSGALQQKQSETKVEDFPT